MINIINEKRTSREVVRISLKSDQDYDKNPGKIASFILKSLILEDKEVYIKYISEKEIDKELTYKTKKVLNHMQRMLNDSLDTICGGFGKTPEKYRGKNLTIVTGLPYNKDTPVSTYEKNEDGSYARKTEDVPMTKRATVIRLYLLRISYYLFIEL